VYHLKKAIIESGFIFCLLVVALTACYAQGEKSSTDVLLGVGDTIQIRIPIEPMLSGEYTVDQTGKFYLPIIQEGLDLGAFYVEGKNCAQVEVMIKERIDKYYAESDVKVDLVAVGIRPGHSIGVFGAVTNSGSYKYYDGMRIIDLIILCGELKEGADQSRVSLYRGDDPVRYIDIRKIIDGEDFTNNILLHEGDYLIFPYQQSKMKMRITVLGKVGNPGTMFVEEGTQILDLIARAGGPFGRAAVGKTYIIRMFEGKPVVIHSDIKNLINRADLKENVMLMDGDIVFVPESSKIDVSKLLRDLASLNLLKDFIDEIEEHE